VAFFCFSFFFCFLQYDRCWLLQKKCHQVSATLDVWTLNKI
jgi:hypothetical protein